jgi:hypothetical protein
MDHLKPYEFKRGQEKTPGSGRRTGTRNKLSEAFLRDLHAEWERSGQAALRILAVEQPAMLAGLVAKVIPQAFDADMPATLHIVTGVVRAGDIEHYPDRTPQIPPAAPFPALPVKEGDDANDD